MSLGQHSFAGSFALPNRAFYHSLRGAWVWQFPWCGAWSRVSTRSLVGTCLALEDGGGSSRLTGVLGPACGAVAGRTDAAARLARGLSAGTRRSVGSAVECNRRVTAGLRLRPRAARRGGCCRGTSGFRISPHPARKAAAAARSGSASRAVAGPRKTFRLAGCVEWWSGRFRNTPVVNFRFREPRRAGCAVRGRSHRFNHRRWFGGDPG